ncbi:DUF6089 family protein [Aquimarina sp. ERC-38]|uniref:type IX secretion system protein PorG n=1 Tax=Aquimarina sp. ERC-38 TaxID=2949996 RepID=UPI0022457BDB|nr:DUF6089 family protein [Aquimarina sp. ERC-38]UZO81181.1 DUF6089 family protein [Aquimarina sp. ERC-38]
MRYFICAVMTLLTSLALQAQTYEVGMMLGGANYIGDVGSTTFISPNDFSIGAIAKWNRSKRHAFRASFLYAGISADDANGDDRREVRDFSFTNSVKELSLGIEYNFWEWYLYDGEPQFTPYLYTGITAFSYGAQVVDAGDNNRIKTYDNTINMAIPMVVGIKKTVSRSFVLGAEIGARYTFTDNLDGSDPDSSVGSGFGNLNNNDWYVFTGLTFSFTWGRIPCYCTF